MAPNGYCLNYIPSVESYLYLSTLKRLFALWVFGYTLEYVSEQSSQHLIEKKNITTQWAQCLLSQLHPFCWNLFIFEYSEEFISMSILLSIRRRLNRRVYGIWYRKYSLNVPWGRLVWENLVLSVLKFHSQISYLLSR